MGAPLDVVFFLISLGGGGAESHSLRVMNHLDRARIRPSLAVCRAGGSYEPMLAPDVRVSEVSLGRVPSTVGRVALAPLGLAALIARRRPAAIVSVGDFCNIAAIGAFRWLPWRPRLIACVQIPPTIEYARTRLGHATLRAIRGTYHQADRVIALSKGVARDLALVDPRIGARTEVIYNACTDPDASDVDDDAVPATTRPVFLAAGRLTRQKGFPDLLDAFARVGAQHDAELWILGEGPDREALEARARGLGVRERVTFFGFRTNPRAFMRRATAFVLSSLYEGFGNVVVEALSVGTPVVSTACPHGPDEILEHERSGLLVPVSDPAALAAAMCRILDDEPLRARLRVAGLERSRAFASDVIAAQYAEAIERVVARSPRQ